jgi:RNA polymerase sporulation-specific sigma factor
MVVHDFGRGREHDSLAGRPARRLREGRSVRPSDVERAREGDQAATERIVADLRPMIRSVARLYFAPGLTLDDLRQEATIGVWKAIVDYRADAGLFASFAELCARRQVITAVKTATRGKHSALNHSARRTENDEGEEIDITDVLESGAPSAAERMEMRDELRSIGRGLRVALSRDEAAALILFSAGASYGQIVAATKFPNEKSVDNALQRARGKLAGVVPVPDRREYVCPQCGHETVRVQANGHARRGPGRPPVCNVCQLRNAA